MNIKDEIFEAYGEMKAEQDLLAVGYTALLGTSMAAKSGEAALLNRFSARYVRECQNLYEKWNPSPILEVFAAHKERKVLTRLGASAWYPAGGGGVMAALWHFLMDSDSDLRWILGNFRSARRQWRSARYLTSIHTVYSRRVAFC